MSHSWITTTLFVVLTGCSYRTTVAQQYRACERPVRTEVVEIEIRVTKEREVIKEVIREVPKEVVKEVVVEKEKKVYVPVYKPVYIPVPAPTTAPSVHHHYHYTYRSWSCQCLKCVPAAPKKPEDPKPAPKPETPPPATQKSPCELLLKMQEEQRQIKVVR